MQAAAFIIQKYQLYKHHNPDDNFSEALLNITEVLNNKLRPLVKVAQPNSFEELWEVAWQLEENHKIKSSREKNIKKNITVVVKLGTWRTSAYIGSQKTKMGSILAFLIN